MPVHLIQFHCLSFLSKFSIVQGCTQSRQSAKLCLQSLELDSPNPTLAGERERGWDWRVPIPTRGHTLWYSLYGCTFWGCGSEFILYRSGSLDLKFHIFNKKIQILFYICTNLNYFGLLFLRKKSKYEKK